MEASEHSLILEHLAGGEIHISGQFMWGSNYTFLCKVSRNNQELPAVYKPVRGERPLWDFPEESLAGREVSAYLISEAAGWKFVPPTVYRRDGPAGPGSLQLFVEHDPNYHYYTFSTEDKARLRPVVLFDCIANNADRKGGHILIDPDSRLWLIDHGICFHVEPKLRTVIWDFAGLPLSDGEQQQISTLDQLLGSRGSLRSELAPYLSGREIQALQDRIKQLLQAGVFPLPVDNYPNMPWPPL